MIQIKLFLIFILSCSYGLSQVGGVKTFKDWKNEKIQLISGKINTIKLKIESEKSKRPAGDPTLSSYYDRMLSQEQWNMDIAKELSVTDYIALYLTQNPSKTKFQEAATQLSVTDVAEIIEAYSQSLPEAQPTLPKQATQHK